MVVLALIALIVIVPAVMAFVVVPLLRFTVVPTALFFERLFAVMERAEAIEGSKAIPTPSLARSVWYWLCLKFLRLRYPLVSFVFPVSALILVYCGFRLFFKLLDYTGWVGGFLLGAMIVRSRLSRLGKFWLTPFGQIAFCMALGIAPQFLFLCAYNGFKDAHMIPPPGIAWLIHAYEYLSVSLYTTLEPIKEMAWYWWVLAIFGLLLFSMVLRLPRLFSTSLRLRETLDAIIFITWVTTSVGVSATLGADNYEPNIQARLHAHLQETMLYETKLNLAIELARWFTENRASETALPIYVRNLDDALDATHRDVGQGGKTEEDVVKGESATAEALVPVDIGTTLTKAMPPVPVHGRVVDSTGTLLRRDAEIQQRNEHLKQQADQAREAAVATIASLVDVPVNTIPLLREVVAEMINVAAEQLSDVIVNRLPLERFIEGSHTVHDTVSRVIAANIAAISNGLFGLRTSLHRPLNGTRPDEVRRYTERETERFTTVREQEEERARARARERELREAKVH
jgi:hypothetical protein